MGFALLKLASLGVQQSHLVSTSFKTRMTNECCIPVKIYYQATFLKILLVRFHLFKLPCGSEEVQ